MAESNTVTAVKNGKTRIFTRSLWDIIGTDKYGWVEIVEPPSEVLQPAPTTETKHKHKRQK